MHWMISLDALDTTQEAILDEVVVGTGSHWIEGYAGTGKTIVLTHAVKKLRAKNKKASLCFVTYTHALKDLVASGLGDDNIDIFTVDSFVSQSEKYDWAFVDEVQDITEEKIRKIQELAKHTIWAGDPAQSLYHKRVQQRALPAVLGTKSKKLKHIYRLSEKTYEIASTIYPWAQVMRGALVSVVDDVDVQLFEASTRAKEFAWVWSKAKIVSAVGRPSAVLFPTHEPPKDTGASSIYDFACAVAKIEGKPNPPPRDELGRITDYSKFNEHFRKHRIPLQFLGSDNGDLPESDTKRMCYLMTYKSAKGLDFNSVFLPGLTSDISFEDGKMPKFTSDEWQRKFFFVALTRSRRDLFMSYHGVPHPFLREMPKEHFVFEKKKKRRKVE